MHRSVLVALALIAATASAQAAQCPGPTNESTAAQLKADRNAFASGHYAFVKRQTMKLRSTASACIANGVDVGNYHYVHAWASMLEGQSRIALGDTSGIVQFQNAAKEADGLANNPNADPDLRAAAHNLVQGERYVMNELLRAKKGQLIHPPPTPKP